MVTKANIITSMSKKPIIDDDMNEEEFQNMISDKNNTVRAKIHKDIGGDLDLKSESEIFVDRNE